MAIKQDGKDIYNETRRIIRDAKTNNRLVLFVGAGASVDSGMPLWKEAVNQISEKLPLSENVDQSDSLKIAQYYYNSRGKKEYTQLVRDIFLYGKLLKTTELHKKLIECQAETIITTNYDHLIEQASEENAEVRYIISKDADLPYKNSSRELIKMHGDFENDNFVLKEDDYLNYSNHFKLIETYIRSLIGSKVVLFVGYSLNDPDVKQILSWVKDVLKDDFQRAYLIQADKKKNEIERDYFRNLGVNIIYTSEIIENWDKKTQTEQLVEFFDYILEDENERALDRVYNELKPLLSLNYVYGKYIRNALMRYYIFCKGDEIDLSNRDNNENENDRFKQLLWTYFEKKELPEEYKTDYYDLEKLKTIEMVISKSCYKKVCRREGRKAHKIQIRNNVSNQIDELVYMFNFKELANLKNYNATKLSSDSPDIYMEQAYICSLLNDYYTAYNCLKNASKVYYKNKNYTWYFLAEFNRKYVGQICMDPFMAPNLSEDEYNKLETEIGSINIEQIIDTIPELGHNYIDNLRELNDFKIAYTLFYDMFSDALKANEEAKTAYTLFTGPAAYEKLRTSAQDYYRFETFNYILLDRYNEVRSIFLLYLRSIISSVMADDIQNMISDKYVYYTENIKQDKLNAFDIYIMIRYLSKSDLKKLIKEYDIKVLPLDEEALNYLESIADSIISAKEYLNENFISEDVFWVFLELISHVNISKTLAAKVMEHLSGKWDERDYVVNMDSINSFVDNICSEDYYSDTGVCTSALNMVEKIFDLLIEDSRGSYHFIVLTNNLLYICNQGGTPYNNCKKIKEVLDKADQSFCAEIYINLGLNCQQPIKRSFAIWKPMRGASDYRLYCKAVFAEIILPDEKIEQTIYKWIKTTESKRIDKGGSGKKIMPNDYTSADVIKGLGNLFINDLIIDTAGLKNTVALADDMMTRWIVNIEDFDYDQFDCNWLDLCHSGLLMNIAKNEIARKAILSSYKKQFESKAVLSNIGDIIIKYFISEPEEVKY